MRFPKPLVITPKMMLSFLLSWVGLLATAFTIGLRLG
jgi:hypothetical protein